VLLPSRSSSTRSSSSAAKWILGGDDAMVAGISQSHAAGAMVSANGRWRWSLGGGAGGY
jgi:hypothetical protein